MHSQNEPRNVNNMLPKRFKMLHLFGVTRWGYIVYYLKEFVKTTVILVPGVGNKGSVLHRMLRFRWIRFRILRGSKSDYSTMILAFFPENGEPF